jgi:WD40 repeat protein
VIGALGIMCLHIPNKIDLLDQNDIFAQLQQKNQFFKSFLERLISTKTVELKNVTGTTLDTVLSYQSPCPRNRLPMALEEYILKKALDFFNEDRSQWYTHVFKGHNGKVTTIRYCVDLGQIASGDTDGTVRLWDVQTGECEYRCKCAAPITDLMYFDDHSSLAIATNSNDVILLGLYGYAVTKLSHPEPIYSIDLSNKLLLTSAEKNYAYLWDFSEENPGIIGRFSSLTQCTGRRISSGCSTEGNEVHYTYHDEKLMVCKAALENCVDNIDELKKILIAQCTEDLFDISRMPFKIALIEKIRALKRNGSKK